MTLPAELITASAFRSTTFFKESREHDRDKINLVRNLFEERVRADACSAYQADRGSSGEEPEKVFPFAPAA
jgi:hypothetical protein